MAKKSILARNAKRAKMHAQYAEKRAELKAAGDLEGLHKLPRKQVVAAHICVSLA
jgi:small subunit ribosomal protein S14